MIHGGAEQRRVTYGGATGPQQIRSPQLGPARAPPTTRDALDELFDDRADSPGHPAPSDADIGEIPPNDHGNDDAMSVGFLGSLEPSAGDTISMMMLQELGAVTNRSRGRERRTAFRRAIAEIYSPPRVTAELLRQKNRQILPSFALDLTVLDPEDGQPWDFSRKSKQDKALKMLHNEVPYVLIGSPMCTAFSLWQRLNNAKSKDPAAVQRAYDRAVKHMEFVCMLYREQLAAGRYFLHEHPEGASSWSLKCITDLMDMPEVQRVVADQCQYGAEAVSGPDAGGPIKKPTGFMTNSPELMATLCKRCQGKGGGCSRPQRGRHVTCSGRVAREAAIYPRGL